MRRGSPALDANKPLPSMSGGPQYDPVAGLPAHMMYSNPTNPAMLTPGDQAQIQMNQQMQQFMQMQMQFMQMMAANGNGPQRSMSHMPSQSMGALASMGGPMGGIGLGVGMGLGGSDMRHSFIDSGSVMDAPMSRPEHMRTMSMVQPSSASWVQPPLHPGYASSIRFQGAQGYAPSIAPSERSNIGLPGRYRPVSQIQPTAPLPDHLRKSMTMSGAIGGWEQDRKQTNKSPLQSPATPTDDDDEEGWEAMKTRREKKKSMWRSKKSLSGLGALIS